MTTTPISDILEQLNSKNDIMITDIQILITDICQQEKGASALFFLFLTEPIYSQKLHFFRIYGINYLKNMLF